MSENQPEFEKYLQEFLQDCVTDKIPGRKRSGKGESDRHYMIKLLDHWWYNLAPRAEELLRVLDKSKLTVCKKEGCSKP